MPSVEAATREAAVAAAREQYGPSARVVGVRKVRSGGVMGFFATERYVAEVELPEDDEPAGRRARPRHDAAMRREPAPLSQSARRIEEALRRDELAGGSARDVWREHEERRARTRTAPAARPAVRYDDDLPDPVDELAGLLGGGAEPELDVYSRTAAARPGAGGGSARSAALRSAAARTTAARSTTPRTAAAAPGVADALRAAAPRPAAGRPAARPPATPVAEPAPAGPSLFTAALAQVVAGDREVREAVDVAVAQAEPQGLARALGRQERPSAAALLRTPAAPAAPVMGLADALAAAQAAPRPAPAPAPAPVPAAAAPAPAPAPVAAVEPEPVAVAPEPVVAQQPVVAPQPVAAAQPVAAPEPVSVVPEPAVVVPEPVAVVPEPAVVVPEPAAVVPEPVAVVPEPVAVVPEPVAVVPEPEPVPPAPAPVVAPAPAAPVALFPVAEPVTAAVDMWAEPAAVRPQPLAPRPVVVPLVVEPVPLPDVVQLRPRAVVVPELPEVELPVQEQVAEPVDVPTPVVPEWMSEPELTAGPASLREEAIAEVLRAALAHDTSDDVLTDILRGVLSSTSAGRRPAVPAYATRTDQLAWVDAAAESDEWEVDTQVLAPTASDPAPMPLDATAVLPPLSLLPPPTPGTQLAVPPLLSRPPVPPPRRRPPVPGQSVARVASSRAGLATVTPLPARPGSTWHSGNPVVVTSVRERPATGVVPSGRELVDPRMVEAANTVSRLRALGVPEDLLGGGFAGEVAAQGTYAALTRALSAALPTAPAAPTGPGEVLLVVGPGVETLAAARSLAASLRLDGDRLQWATRGDLASLAPEASRISSVDTALERKQQAANAGTLTIVAVDAPLRASGRTWLEQMLAIWSPTAVWAVVEATRKPEDVGPWLDALPRVDALMVQDTDLTADPAAVLGRATAPVALLDGVRATAHRWASLLCERLETAEA
ncbi:hypothetical protein [Blastococcus sp. SYSU D00820]